MNMQKTSPYGPDDEIGQLNRLKTVDLAELMARADFSALYDLSVDYFIGMPTILAGSEPEYAIWMVHTPHGNAVDGALNMPRSYHEEVSYSGDAISMYTHAGTHIDALNHFGHRGTIWNGFTQNEHLGSRHWTKCGADRLPPIITRAVLLDVAEAKGVSELPPSYAIGPEDLQATLKRQRVEVRSGDFVLIRTGRMRQWPKREEYLLDRPGLNRAGAELLANAGAIAIGADNSGLEAMPSEEMPDRRNPVHTYLLAEAGVPIMENVFLEEVARDHAYELVIILASLKLVGATGAPGRPIAFRLRP